MRDPATQKAPPNWLRLRTWVSFAPSSEHRNYKNRCFPKKGPFREEPFCTTERNQDPKSNPSFGTPKNDAGPLRKAAPGAEKASGSCAAVISASCKLALALSG